MGRILGEAGTELRDHLVTLLARVEEPRSMADRLRSLAAELEGSRFVTDRLGSGDYYLPSPAGQGAEARFRLRERFTDVLEEEVTQACDDLRHAVQTAIETLSTVRKDQDAVEQLLGQRGLTGEAQPRYGEAFDVWPPPTFPRDANDLRLDDIERLEQRWALDSGGLSFYGRHLRPCTKRAQSEVISSDVRDLPYRCSSGAGER